jgi:NAD(P)-dependent dehydrogenase (short-subunit alcohol dehydrogenase family)
MINPGLDGKIILITGANHGIGAATAKAFAAQGAGVFITYFGQPSPADAMEAVKRIGGRVEAWEADLADPAVIPRLFDRAENALGPVDVQTGWIPKEKEAEITSGIPLGRLGQPDDVADVIVFVASEQARWLTGQTIFVGGGGRVI